MDHNKNYVIGAPGFGRDADDFVEEGMVYCMGGTGMIYSNAVIRQIRPHLKTCISNLMTEHEDVEIGRCFFRHTGTNCNVSTSRDCLGNYNKDLRQHTTVEDFSFKIGQNM